MKIIALATTIALLATEHHVSAQAAAASGGAAVATGGGTAVTVAGAGGKGKATIVIDVNGKRETREIDLGNATEVKVGGGPSVMVTTVGTGGTEKAAPRTWLGVATDEVSEELRAQLPIADGTGLLVRNVMDESPAAKAGVTKNDVLLKFDDQILTNADQLRALVGTKKDGDTVRLTFLRRGKESTADVTLGSREGGEQANSLSGILSGLAGTLNLTGKGGTLDLSALSKLVNPITVQSRAVVIDKDGKVVASQGGEMKDAVKQLEQSLRESGVDGKVIDETKRALGDAVESLQKAAGELGATKGDLARRIEQALKSATEAVEQGRKAAEEARKQAEAAEKKATEAAK